MKQVTSPPKAEEKPKEDKGLFLQVPYYVIDNLDMTDNAKIGFIRFCRLFNKKDKTIEFRGYYRGLASALKKSPAHTISIVDQWVKFNLIQREVTLDGVILRANTAAIWHRNKIHKEAEQCLNYEQKRLYTEENTTSAVYEINTAVQNINTAVYEINTAMQIMNSRGMDGTTPEAALGLNEIASRLLDYTRLLLDNKYEGQNNDSSPDGFATATPNIPAFAFTEVDPLAEDLPQPVLQSFAYSHNQPQPTHSQTSLEIGSSAVEPGYRQDQASVKQPEKPNKRTSRQRKPKVEQPVLVDTSKKTVALNEAEQQRFDWYCNLDFNRVKPEPDARKKQHCATLLQHVHSQEDMKSLADFTKGQLEKQGIKVYIVHLGNMANSTNLNTWLAQQSTNNKVVDIRSKQKVDTFAHVPAFGGKTEEEIQASGKDILEFLRAQGMNIPAAM